MCLQPSSSKRWHGKLACTQQVVLQISSIKVQKTVAFKVKRVKNTSILFGFRPVGEWGQNEEVSPF